MILLSQKNFIPDVLPGPEYVFVHLQAVWLAFEIYENENFLGSRTEKLNFLERLPYLWILRN